jgi:hypothetical protein
MNETPSIALEASQQCRSSASCCSYEGSQVPEKGRDDEARSYQFRHLFRFPHSCDVMIPSTNLVVWI